ncbi:MAG: hypothetical protein JSS83_27220 [Cyanobacteria bacterium SZAS LIN-3]|nr:hypothetical protein [Cyanobacteria bacterium SZAS LIN-3]MBS2005716.1 hypothetical protein [Cyanobacteria bacterium SZAS TMP-1]
MKVKMQAGPAPLWCLASLIISAALSPLAALPSMAAATPEAGTLTTHDLLVKAYEQICKSDFEQAMPTLCDLVRSDPNSPSARRYLAFVLLQEGHAKEALVQLEILNRLQEGVTFDILLRGVANDMVGKHEKALELFKETMARDPKSDYYRIKTIDELLVLLRYDEAMTMANEGLALAKDPKIVAVYQQKIRKINSILRLTGRMGTCKRAAARR